MADGGFQACGGTYASEHEAIAHVIDRFRVEEAAGGMLFGAWADQCNIPELRGGLRVIAEREAYHARIFERRLKDLGRECQAELSDPKGFDLADCLIDPGVPDAVKLKRFNDFIGDAAVTTRPIREFGDAIAEDVETKAALALFVEDEFSTISWLRRMGDRLDV